jgi:hypothetical protein
VDVAFRAPKDRELRVYFRLIVERTNDGWRIHQCHASRARTDH